MKILELIETIARERCIKQEEVAEIIESILLDCAIERYGDHNNLTAKIYPDGSFEVSLEREVVEECDDSDFSRLSLAKAKARNTKTQLGEVIKEVLPFSINKTDIEKIYGAFCKRLNEIQKKNEYEIFKDLIGQNVNGYIKRVDATEAVISFPEGEGVLRKSDMLKGDILHVGNYIKVNVKDVKQSMYRQIYLSRTNDNFLRELIKQEVPEVKEGLIEIKAIAREPGSLAKIAVFSDRSSINPVLVCIGSYGSRMQAVTRELFGERVSIIKWSENILEFISNALSPGRVLRVVQVAPSKYKAITEQEEFPKVMGRGGQNVILAKRLCGVQAITLYTKEEDATLYQNELNKKVENLIERLSIEAMMAHILIAEKFDTVQKISSAQLSELAALSGFDEELAQVLQTRASEFLQQEQQIIKDNLAQLKKNDSLFDLKGLLSNENIQHLINKGVYQKNELAMLDTYELVEMFDDSATPLNLAQGADIIAAARCIARRDE